MNITEIRDLVFSVFSKTGLKHNDYTITCPSPLNCNIHGDGTYLHLKFVGELPQLSVKKFITMSVDLQEIYSDRTGGIIRLKNFPDIRFTYDQFSDSPVYGSCDHYENEMHLLDGLADEVNSRYGSDPKKGRMASRVLQHCETWAEMSLRGGTQFYGMSKLSRKAMVDKCVKHVTKQMKEDRHGSIVIVLLINWLLPYIIKSIAERMIDRLING